MAAIVTKDLLVRILGDDTKLTKTVGRLDSSFMRIQAAALERHGAGKGAHG